VKRHEFWKPHIRQTVSEEGDLTVLIGGAVRYPMGEKQVAEESAPGDRVRWENICNVYAERNGGALHRGRVAEGD
jgi:hypothetical protein